MIKKRKLEIKNRKKLKKMKKNILYYICNFIVI